MPNHANLASLSPLAYTHRLDKEMSNTLKRLPGFTKSLNLFYKYILDTGLNTSELKNCLTVCDDVYPDLYKHWHILLEKFSLPSCDLSISTSKSKNFWSLRGSEDKPAVILSSHTLEVFSQVEVEVILSMAVTDLKLGNFKYVLLGDLLNNFYHYSNFLALPFIGLNCILTNWRYYSLFSVDGGASLAFPSAQPVLDFLSKQSGLSTKWGGISKDYLSNLKLDDKVQNSLWQKFMFLYDTRSNNILKRYLSLTRFVNSDDYQDLLKGEDFVNYDPETDEDINKDVLALWGSFSPHSFQENMNTDFSTPLSTPGYQDYINQALSATQSLAKAGLGGLAKTADDLSKLFRKNISDT